ncbi:MAG: transglycosylase domain-containing protein, partial [Hyphomicrobiales bacterium]
MPRISTTKRLRNRLLSIDSSVDAGMFGLGHWLAGKWTSYAEKADRMRISGFRRIIVDLTSDALTSGTAAVVLIYAWGLPDAPSEKLLYSGAQQYSVVFTDANGIYLGRRGVLHSNAVPLEEIPDSVIEAVLATEDARFYQHFGIDILGTLRALSENVKANGIVQGGSTLTQQVAKNLFLTPERSIQRKIKEAFFSLWMEARLTKRQILKLYLDRAYMGGGTFGVEAAAEYYFNKSIRDINLPEAVMLAGLFKAPTRFSPAHNLPAARARANVVLDRMVDAGFLTDGQARVVRLRPAKLVAPSAENSPEYYLDWAFSEVRRIADGRSYVLRVKTTLDLSRQKQAEDAVQSILRENGKAKGVEEAALVSMKTDGAVQAMIGGRDYGESQFNRAVDAKRQPGSSFKPFVYLTALKNGFTPKTIVIDSPVTIGNWSPKNYSRRYRGRITLATALKKSINVIPVKLAQVFGRKKIAETAKALGIRTELRLNRSMPLGTNEVTVLDMTGGYSVFANGGMEVKPYGVLEI